MPNAVDAAAASWGKMCEPLENKARRWRRETSLGCSRSIGTVACETSVSMNKRAGVVRCLQYDSAVTAPAVTKPVEIPKICKDNVCSGVAILDIRDLTLINDADGSF